MKTDLAPSPTVKYYDANNETIVKTIKEDTNIRELPSTKSKIIEKVEKNASLILLQNSGKWLKVRVKKSGKTGYVYYKNLY
ncbi:SH3 domain-containing protein [Cloacibacterium sp.]|uniref:SH3 domain-containing protein n=1 Tax=Cloacibacterium sp. TaxID=1913682 RepID=UPI0039E470A3